jgi:hypothetical protein
VNDVVTNCACVGQAGIIQGGLILSTVLVVGYRVFTRGKRFRR